MHTVHHHQPYEADDFGYRVNTRIVLWVIVAAVVCGFALWWLNT